MSWPPVVKVNLETIHVSRSSLLDRKIDDFLMVIFVREFLMLNKMILIFALVMYVIKGFEILYSSTPLFQDIKIELESLTKKKKMEFESIFINVEFRAIFYGLQLIWRRRFPPMKLSTVFSNQRSKPLNILSLLIITFNCSYVFIIQWLGFHWILQSQERIHSPYLAP